MAPTPKKVANQTTYTHTSSAPGQYDPFAPPQFTTGNPQLPTQVTRPPSAYANSSGGVTGPWGNFARDTTVTDVPQSYIDDFANNNTNKNGGVDPTGMTQEEFDKAIRYTWSVLPNDQKQTYLSQDQQKVAGINTAGVQGVLTQQTLAGPAQDAAYASKAWEPVTQATQRATTALGAQVTGDRQAEGQLDTAVGDYTGTIRQNQTDRMNSINTTNAGDTQDANNFMTETLAANGRNTGFANQLTDAANSTNANQTGLFNNYSGQMAGLTANQNQLFSNFSGQMAGINANQTGLYNNFMGDIASANAQQNQNLAGLGSAVGSANNAQNQIVAQYSQQLAAMNDQDKAAYLQYINETNPLMAQQIAQASNPAYVKNQEDVVNRYRELSTPQVTDQERFLGELARRKFEGDDQGNRQALMQQLATRGLRSGGLVVAGQQQGQQQLSQDRMLNELGMNANAVQRGLVGMQGYSSASNALRNADDAMKNFSDQYAQNDAVRRGNLAQQRDQQNLNTTGQITARDTSGYNARTQSNNLNYGRNLDYYNAGTQTVNDNFGRTQAGYNAGTQTNNDNSLRDQSVFSAGTTTNTTNQSRAQGVFDAGSLTNTNNFGRTQTAIGTQIGVNQGNLGNYQNAISGPAGTMTVRDANNTRYTGGLTTGDLGAGSILGAQTGAIGFRTGNLQTEASNAVGYVPTATNVATTGIGVQQGLTSEQQRALAQLLGLGTKDQQQAIAGNV